MCNKKGNVDLPNNCFSLNMYGCSHSLRVGYVSLQTEIDLALALLARGTVNSVLI